MQDCMSCIPKTVCPTSEYLLDSVSRGANPPPVAHSSIRDFQKAFDLVSECVTLQLTRNALLGWTSHSHSFKTDATGYDFDVKAS